MSSPPTVSGGLDALMASMKGVKGPAPVHLWNPPDCGPLDIRIAADGTWYYMGTPIGRPALVKLFSSVLKRENGAFYLVTPVEKVRITVDDAPFAAVEMQVEGDGANRRIALRTQVDEWVEVGEGHGLSFSPETETGGLKPYVHVRSDLWARLSRPLFHDLAQLGEVAAHEGSDWFGVRVRGAFYPMVPASEVEGLL